MKKKRIKHFKPLIEDEKERRNQGMYYREYLQLYYGKHRARIIRSNV